MPSRRRALTAVATLLLLAAPVAGARAQDAPSSLPFRAGQSALSANVTSATSGVGALRFTAPTRAVVLNANFSVRRNTETIPTPFGGSASTESATDALVAVELGFRGYRSLSSTAALFHTFGVDGSYSSFDDSRQRSWGAGLFGDVGGQYMLDPRFSLGVSGGLRLGYSNQRYRTGAGTATIKSIGLGTTPARLIGSVYF